jgi:hypothetical protein
MINYYNLSLDNFGDFDDEVNLIEVYKSLAKYYQEIEADLGESLNVLYKILNIFRKQGHLKRVAESLVKIAEVHIDLKDYSSAIECLEESKGIYQSLYDSYNADLIFNKIASLREI